MRFYIWLAGIAAALVVGYCCLPRYPCGHFLFRDMGIGGGHAHCCPQWCRQSDMKRIQEAQKGFQQSRKRDADGNGVGEYGEAVDLFRRWVQDPTGCGLPYMATCQDEKEIDAESAKPLAFLEKTEVPDVWGWRHVGHWIGCSFMIRVFLPEKISERERHWAALIWPSKRTSYCDRTYLVTEEGIYYSPEAFEGTGRMPSLPDAYEGVPFSGSVRWRRLP